MEFLLSHGAPQDFELSTVSANMTVLELMRCNNGSATLSAGIDWKSTAVGS